MEPLPIVGVELGARMESTALSVIERTWVSVGEVFNKVEYGHRGLDVKFVPSRKAQVEYRVRHLERRSAPVFYKGVARRIAELVEAVGDCLVVVDITRTGRPVWSTIRRQIDEIPEDIKAYVTPVLVTVSGMAGGVSRSPDAGWIVPRRDLVSSALLLFEGEALKIAQDLGLAQTLTREFEDFKPKEDPRDDLEGWREAKNDDLVLAVAMSVWAGEKFLRKITDLPAGPVADVPSASPV